MARTLSLVSVASTSRQSGPSQNKGRSKANSFWTILVDYMFLSGEFRTCSKPVSHKFDLDVSNCRIPVGYVAALQARGLNWLPSLCLNSFVYCMCSTCCRVLYILYLVCGVSGISMWRFFFIGVCLTWTLTTMFAFIVSIIGQVSAWAWSVVRFVFCCCRLWLCGWYWIKLLSVNPYSRLSKLDRLFPW